MAILLVQLVTRSQRRSSAGISNTIALRKLGTRNCPCLNRFLSLKAPPLAAGIFYFRPEQHGIPPRIVGCLAPDVAEPLLVLRIPPDRASHGAGLLHALLAHATELPRV